MLQGKKILLGVCGSIAAYKSVHLVRLLIKAGAEVKVVLTPAGADFITPLSLSTVSRNPVLTQFTRNDQGEWNNHVELGLWADAFLIAPASANTLAKMATGLCDNLLMATYLSARCPVIVAPAMDLDMYGHQTTKRNLKQLSSDGVRIIEAAHGELASGLTGIGRMAEPEDITRFLSDFFSANDEGKNLLAGKKVLVTAGPTYEPLDPVRFIGNHSSGKMGYALAEALAEKGAEIHLISGPSACEVNNKNITLVKVNSAEDMNKESIARYPQMDIAILAAAVSDYTPEVKATQKIKKQEEKFALTMIKTPDIAKNLGNMKKEGQINIGFALETENEVVNAKEKLEKKNFDMIILNSLNDKGAGFSHGTNKITIIDKQNNIEQFELKNKKEVAGDIVNALIKIIS
jgi:phosphopantothenoylcysteine decarboxylase/phosphopantothenate--cysteine ligase